MRPEASSTGRMSRLLQALLNEPPPGDVDTSPGSDAALRRGRRLFWRLQIAGWSLVAVVGWPLMTPTFGLADAALATGARGLFGFVGTCLLRELYLRIPWRTYPLPLLLAGAALLSICLGAAETFLCRHLVLLDLRDRMDPAVLAAMERLSILLRCGSFFGWSVLYFTILLWRESAGAALRAARLEAAARTAELRQLQAQVNPHFLFNALNTIVAQKDDPAGVERATDELAGYLRHALRAQDDFAPIGVELELIERYLRVEKSRFEERLVYAIEADAGARATPVPAALVQPLLENACKHGRRSGPRVLEVRIHVFITNDTLVVEVSNTGRWIEPAPAADNHGIGLTNLRRRLELLSGGRAALSHREETGRVVACVTWPLAPFRFAAKEVAA